jgi:hypothetical protein
MEVNGKLVAVAYMLYDHDYYRDMMKKGQAIMSSDVNSI